MISLTHDLTHERGPCSNGDVRDPENISCSSIENSVLPENVEKQKINSAESAELVIGLRVLVANNFATVRWGPDQLPGQVFFYSQYISCLCNNILFNIMQYVFAILWISSKLVFEINMKTLLILVRVAHLLRISGLLGKKNFFISLGEQIIQGLGFLYKNHQNFSWI